MFVILHNTFNWWRESLLITFFMNWCHKMYHNCVVLMGKGTWGGAFNNRGVERDSILTNNHDLGIYFFCWYWNNVFCAGDALMCLKWPYTLHFVTNSMNWKVKHLQLLYSNESERLLSPLSLGRCSNFQKITFTVCRKCFYLFLIPISARQTCFDIKI